MLEKGLQSSPDLSTLWQAIMRMKEVRSCVFRLQGIGIPAVTVRIYHTMAILYRSGPMKDPHLIQKCQESTAGSGLLSRVLARVPRPGLWTPPELNLEGSERNGSRSRYATSGFS